MNQINKIQNQKKVNTTTTTTTADNLITRYQATSTFNRKRRREELNHKYEDLVRVGEGTYGNVFQAIERETKKRVAIKQFKPTKEGEGISLTAYREIMLLRELEHENIIGLKEITVSPDNNSLSLILEYAEYDLSEIIRYHNRIKQLPPSSYTVKSLMWQLLNAMNYLHGHWVVHRDLKPSNILVMGSDASSKGMVKIADFGLARIFQSPLRPLYENGVVVTIWYRAPELLLGSRHYTKAVDMWAVGCIFAEMLTTHPLFPGREKDAKNPNLFQDIQLDKIFRVLGKPNPQIWPTLTLLPDWKTRAPQKWKKTILEENWNNYPEYVESSNRMEHSLGKVPELKHISPNSNAFDLLCQLLEYDPAKRISASNALDHPYFKEQPAPGLNAFQPPNQPSSKWPYPSRNELRKKIKS